MGEHLLEGTPKWGETVQRKGKCCCGRMAFSGRLASGATNTLASRLRAQWRTSSPYFHGVDYLIFRKAEAILVVLSECVAFCVAFG